MRAVATNEAMALTLDLTRKTFLSPAIAETALPDEAQVRISIASEQRSAGAKAGIVFFPGGGSTGGDITIEMGGNRAEIAVNWLTGETRCGLV